MHRLIYLAFALSTLAHGQTYHLAEFQGVSSDSMRFFLQLANAALSPNDQLVLSVPMSPERMMHETAKSNGLSQVMIWTCSMDPSRHPALKRINIPIDRGISSYWLVAVNTAKQAQLAEIKSIEQLKSWHLSTGFPQNNADPMFGELKLQYAPTAQQALEMTAIGRLDGVLLQARMAEELKSQLPAGVVIDPQLALVRANAACFYVQLHQEKLAAALEKGLNRIIKDGQALRLSEQENLSSHLKTFSLEKRRLLFSQPAPYWNASESKKNYPNWLMNIAKP